MVDAAAVARYMAELSYKTTDNYDLANRLSRLSDDLETFGTSVFAKKWNDFTNAEKKIIIHCKKMMESNNGSVSN